MKAAEGARELWELLCLDVVPGERDDAVAVARRDLRRRLVQELDLSFRGFVQDEMVDVLVSIFWFDDEAAELAELFEEDEAMSARPASRRGRAA